MTFSSMNLFEITLEKIKITGEYIGHLKSIIDNVSNKSLLKSLFRLILI